MTSVIEQLLAPRERDLGGFSVRRVLPYDGGRMVGPFIFFDHMGPARFEAGHGVDVRPHPHIGLATVTYLFEGEILHRDSLGSVQPIRPGDVNWMTAGRGIVHSERTPPEEKAAGPRLHGIQTWVALPLTEEETEPGFFHHPAATLPELTPTGCRLRVIAGSLLGASSPVETKSAMFYGDAVMEAGAGLSLAAGLGQRGVYVVEGAVSIGAERIGAGEMGVLTDGEDVEVRADSASRVMLLGGERLEGERHVWWNFVASSKDRIEKAKADWQAGRFPPVPGDNEFIPLPEE